MHETKTITYVGHADAVRLATWMPRFAADHEFEHRSYFFKPICQCHFQYLRAQRIKGQ